MPVSSTATTIDALPVVMSHAPSALIDAGAVPVAPLVPAGPGGFRYHWPTSGPPAVGVDGSLYGRLT